MQRKILAYSTLVLSGMCFVLFVVNALNGGTMGLMNNSITHGLVCALSILAALSTLQLLKRRTRKKRRLTPARMMKSIILPTMLTCVVIGAGLCVFALFHHVLPTKETPIGTTSSRYSMNTTTVTEAPTTVPEITSEPAADQTAEPGIAEAPVMAALTIAPTAEPTPTPTPDPVGCFGTKFADKFTDGEVIDTKLEDGSYFYQSKNLNVTTSKHKAGDAVYYVCDFYVRDITSFRTAFGNDTYGKGQSEWPAKIAARNNAICAVNGDYYGVRSEGAVIRNGVLYRDTTNLDIGVLYWDGTFKTFTRSQTNGTKELEKGAYQLWSFGPMLLDKNGDAMEKFNSTVWKSNPRSAIGYFEPGHYCLVTVDGRSNKSHGMTMIELSKLMKELGCTAAYNLDGGQTAAMVWEGKTISNPADGGRKCSDIVMVGEPLEEE